MGVIYKLRPEIVKFIVSKKKADPRLGCRFLSSEIEKKFKVHVSKSAVNNIIKNNSLSSHVGRPGKARLSLEGDVLHSGFFFIKAIGEQLGIFKLIKQEILYNTTLPNNITEEDLENSIDALVLFRCFYDITDDISSIYNNNEIWHIIGRRPTRVAYRRAVEVIENTEGFLKNFFVYLSNCLRACYKIKLNLRDSSQLVLDGRFRSLWPNLRTPSNLFTTYDIANSYVDKFLASERMLLLFDIQSPTLFSKEVLDLIQSFDENSNKKWINKIEFLDYNNNAIDEKTHINVGTRSYMLGFWPWQFDLLSEFEKKPAKERLIWREVGIELYYQIEELNIPQHIVGKELTVRVIFLRSAPRAPIKMGLLTNLPADVIGKSLLAKELRYWLTPEQTYKYLTKANSTGGLTLSELERLLKFHKESSTENKENNGKISLSKTFDLIGGIILERFRIGFLPVTCQDWNMLKIKDLFFRQRGHIQKGSNITVHKVLLSNNLCKREDMEHVFSALNNTQIKDQKDSLLWFNLAE